MIDDIFEELISERVVVVYLDDILIFTDTLEEHQLVTWCVTELMAKHKLYLKPDKCKFEQTTVEYLGVIISHNSVSIDLVKIARVQEWPEPTNKKEVQSFLGFTNFSTSSSKTSWNTPNHSLTLPRMTPNSTGYLMSNQPSTDSSKVSYWHQSSSPPTQLSPSTLKLTALTLPLVQCSLKSAPKMSNSTQLNSSLSPYP